MKILHLTHTDIPSDNRILKELSALAEVQTYQLYAIGIRQVQAGADSKVALRARIESLTLFSRNLRALPSFLRHALVAIEMCVKLLYRGLRIRPDIVHCHDTPVLVVGVLLKRLLGARLVYDAHELESRKNAQSPIISRTTLYLEKFSWSSIDHLISVSPSIIAWYRDHLGAKMSSLVMNSPMFAVEDMTAAQDAESKGYFHRRYTIPRSERVFIYLGLLVPGRGVEILLDAFSSNETSSHVVFIGHGALSASIENAAGYVSRIHLHPAVPHEEVVALSRHADCGLCIIENASLSDYYCLPNKLFEYAFAGVPVLASNFPDMSAVVREFALGECCEVDRASVVAAVNRIASQPNRRLQSDLEPLGWRAQAEKLRAAYATLEPHEREESNS